VIRVYETPTSLRKLSSLTSFDTYRFRIYFKRWEVS